MTPYASGQGWELLHGDCIDAMRGMADASVDAIVCDPPYALTSRKMRVGFANCLRYVGLRIEFPDLGDRDAEGFECFDLSVVLGNAPLLNAASGDGIDAGIGVPVCSVDLQSGCEVGQPEVNHEGEAAEFIPKGDLRNEADPLPGHLVGDFALQLRRDKTPSFCDGACGCFRQLGPRRFAVGVIVRGAALGSSFLRADAPSLAGTLGDDIRSGDNPLGRPGGPSSVMAGGGAELRAVLTFDLGRRSAELRPADGADECYFLLQPVGAEGIGAWTRTGSLAPPPKPLDAGAVASSADGADPRNRLFVHSEISSFLSGIISHKGFMGKEWDNPEVAFSAEVWRDAFRVARPGAHLLAFGGGRTHHRLFCAIEDAGFECRETLVWLFGSGFPKSRSLRDIGWPELGTALKPAAEFICLARKPLAEGTVAANVLAWGTGGLNIDATRIGVASDDPNRRDNPSRDESPDTATWNLHKSQRNPTLQAGRWPANCVLSHVPPDENGEGGCEQVGTRRVKSGVWGANQNTEPGSGGTMGKGWAHQPSRDAGIADADGTEEVEAWNCAPGCAVRLLDEQSGQSVSSPRTVAGRRTNGSHGYGFSGDVSSPHNDTGGASRFFYTAKSSRSERGKANDHPTVKPVALMRWLCRLITPPGGLILDPFAGSGSTGVAAIAEGVRFIGIEKESEYCEMARERLAGVHPRLPGLDLP